MAYIDYKKLKGELTFQAVLSHYNLPHTDRIQEMIHSPFPGSDDSKPSCSINHEKRIFQCFSSGKTGTSLDFVCFMEGLDPKIRAEFNQGAVIAVRDILGIDPTSYSPTNKKGKGANPSPSVVKQASSTSGKDMTEGQDQVPPHSADKTSTATKTTQATTNQPLGFALKNLATEHPVYTARNITPQTITTFGLGVASKGIMKDRLVFPIHNAGGKLVAYAGRWPDDNPPEGEGKYKLPPGFNKSLELYNQHRASAVLKAQDWSQALVIVEGFWSAIRLHQAGFAVVASFGHDLSVAQAKAIAKLTNDALIVYDGDKPGRAGAERSAGLLSQHVFIRTFMLEDDIKPDVMDLDLIRAIVT